MGYPEFNSVFAASRDLQVGWESPLGENNSGEVTTIGRSTRRIVSVTNMLYVRNKDRMKY